jgi:hypothetical protein
VCVRELRELRELDIGPVTVRHRICASPAGIYKESIGQSGLSLLVVGMAAWWRGDAQRKQAARAVQPVGGCRIAPGCFLFLWLVGLRMLLRPPGPGPALGGGLIPFAGPKEFIVICGGTAHTTTKWDVYSALDWPDTGRAWWAADGAWSLGEHAGEWSAVPSRAWDGAIPTDRHTRTPHGTPSVGGRRREQ